MMVVPVETDPTFRPGNSVMLFEAAGLLTRAGPRAFDIAPDGQRFLMIRAGAPDTETVAPTQINVVLNWHEELKERIPIP